ENLFEHVDNPMNVEATNLLLQCLRPLRSPLRFSVGLTLLSGDLLCRGWRFLQDFVDLPPCETTITPGDFGSALPVFCLFEFLGIVRQRPLHPVSQGSVTDLGEVLATELLPVPFPDLFLSGV